VEPTAAQRSQVPVSLPTNRWIWGRVVSEAAPDAAVARDRDGFFFGLAFTVDRKSWGLNLLE
jgi:hypothetical protein